MPRQQGPLVKILVAGASQVGKTSLVQSYVFNDFFDASPTIGINFAQKVSLGEQGPLNLSIWDLSGELRFKFLIPQFCSGALGLILVFDQARSDTLEASIEWLEFIGRYAHPFHRKAIVLVGAKSDLRSQVPLHEINMFCSKHKIAAFISCSAKTGVNVHCVFERLTTIIQQNLSELAFPPLPQLAVS